jgi:hypothetical protein
MSVWRWRRILLWLSLHAPLLLAAGVRILSCGRAVRRISTTIVGGEPRQVTVSTAFAVVSEGCWWVVEWRRNSHAICRRWRPKPMLLLLWCSLCATSVPLLQQASIGCSWMVLRYTDQGGFRIWTARIWYDRGLFKHCAHGVETLQTSRQQASTSPVVVRWMRCMPVSVERSHMHQN